MVLEEADDRRGALVEVVPNSFAALAAVAQTEDQNIAPMEVQNIAPTVVQMCTVVVHYTLVVAVVVGLTFVAEAWVDLAFLSVEAFHQVADPAFDEEQEEVGHDSSGVVDPDSF